MNKELWIVVILVGIISGVIGYGLGFKDGSSYTLNKLIKAGELFFNIELKDKAKALVAGFPFIMDKIDDKLKIKLGLNDSEWEDYRYNKLNESITELIRMKYG